MSAPKKRSFIDRVRSTLVDQVWPFNSGNEFDASTVIRDEESGTFRQKETKQSEKPKTGKYRLTKQYKTQKKTITKPKTSE